MKTFLITCVLALGYLLTGCEGPIEDSDSPFEWVLYVSFVNDQNEDFFEANPDISIATLGYNTTGPDHAYNRPSNSIRVDGKLALNVIFCCEEVYFKIGSLEVDTLRAEIIYNGNNSANQLTNIDKITHYFNGTLVNEWDFLENPNLKNEIYERNSVTSRPLYDETFTPIVIILPK